MADATGRVHIAGRRPVPMRRVIYLPRGRPVEEETT
jgi:hypothetical protein